MPAQRIGSGKRSRGTRFSLGGAAALALMLAAACGKGHPALSGSPGPLTESAGPSAEATSTVGGATLLSLNGTGDQSSAPFNASGTSVNVTYSFTCSEAGSFTLNFYGANASPALPDVLDDEFGTSGGATVSEALNGKTGPFHVEVVTTCAWSVKVEGTP